MEQKLSGGLPPHIWRQIGAPQRATTRRPRGSVSSGRLVAWIAILIVVVALIFLAVGALSPEAASDTGNTEPQAGQTVSPADEPSDTN